MDYHLTVIERPGYLHAKVTGTNEPGNVLRFLRESYEACTRQGRTALLLEMELSGPSLASRSIFDVITRRSEDGARLRKIAYVDHAAAKDPEKVKFAETVAINRGVSVRLFPDVPAAEKWLAPG